MTRQVFLGATSALMALGQEQNNRLLVLAFPRGGKPEGAILLANRLVAEEGLSRDFRFEVEVLSDDARIPLKKMMGKMVTVSLVREDGTLRHFNGYVREFRLVKADGGYAWYRAVLEPWLAFARLRRNSAVFQEKTVVEITEEIFNDYEYRDWRKALFKQYPPLSCAIQYDETDHNHLHRRWEDQGLYYWYEHRADGHTLWIGDTTQMAEPIDPGGNGNVRDEIPFRRHAGSGEDDGVYEWQAVRRLGSGSTTVRTFNYKNPQPLDTTRSSKNQQGAVPPYEVFESAGAYAFASYDDGDRLAQQRMEEHDALGQFFEARGNDRTVQPGRSFRLGGHFSGAPRPVRRDEPAKPDIGNREYVILTAVHEASNNYQAGRGAESKYECRFTCIRKDIPWRPGRGFNSKPVAVPGVQTAIVVGPQGCDIHTDEYGRVKVQFHWDRKGKNDAGSSAWVRVASVWAGNDLGFVAVPRIGQEVAVQCVAGNPDHPLIIGRMFNRDNLPPWQLSGQQALSGLRSRELTPGGGNAARGRSNHLILDDTNGQIQAQLKSDHLHSQLSLGYITRIEDNRGRTDARGEGFELRTDGHGVARASKGLLITTEARHAAHGPIKDMGETVRRLTAAREMQERQAELAEQNGAQERKGQQSDVAEALKTQIDAIRGKDAVSPGNSFAELSEPQLVLASPAGIATTTAQSTHIASDLDTAITTGKSVSIAAGDGFFATIRETLRLFVQKAGMKMVAAAGDIDIKALTDNVNVLAKLNITQTANRIVISAREDIVINGGGSYAKFSSSGIEHGTSGSFVAHAASHSLLSPINMRLPDVNPSSLSAVDHETEELEQYFSFEDENGKSISGFSYRIDSTEKKLDEGALDDSGRTRGFPTDKEIKYTCWVSQK